MKDALQNIKFHYQCPTFYFPNRTRLKIFLLKQLKKEGRVVEAINYIFCDDAYLLEMNRKYLKHDTLTDIITFELSSKNQPILSDIFISVDRVRENADLFKVPFSEELRRVIFHGALHLCGLKDKKKEDIQVMRKKEEEYLRLFEVSRKTVS